MRDQFTYADLTNEALVRFMDNCRVRDSGCWEWVAGVRRTKGRLYPYLSIRGKQRMARVVGFMMAHFRDPLGTVTPSCGNQLCVCPGHMEEYRPKGMDAETFKNTVLKHRWGIKK